MNTRFKPNLEQYGKVNILIKLFRKFRSGLLSVRKLLLIIIVLPIGTAWMVIFLPFAKGFIWWKLWEIKKLNFCGYTSEMEVKK